MMESLRVAYYLSHFPKLIRIHFVFVDVSFAALLMTLFRRIRLLVFSRVDYSCRVVFPLEQQLRTVFDIV